MNSYDSYILECNIYNYQLSSGPLIGNIVNDTKPNVYLFIFYLINVNQKEIYKLCEIYENKIKKIK